MIQETFSGVELLALYGDDDERIGLDDEMLGISLRRGIRNVGRGLKKTAKYTPHYQAFRAAKWGAKKAKKTMRFRGEDGRDYLFEGDSRDVEELGKAKPGPGLRKIGRGIKSVGKVTSGFTTGIARAVGIPQSVIDATSKLDPTKRGTSVKGAVRAVTPKPAAQPKTIAIVKPSSMKFDAKNFAIIAGAGAVGIVLVKVLSGRRSRSKV